MLIRSVRSNAILYTNSSFELNMGLSASDLKSKSLLDWTHVDDREQLKQAMDAGQGEARARHQAKDGRWELFDWRIRTGSEDVIALGRSHRARDSSLPTANHSEALGIRTMAETLADMARIAEAKNPGMRCSIVLTNASQDRVSVGAGPSFPAEYNAAVEGMVIGPMVGSCGTATYWNVPVVVEDIFSDPLWSGYREVAKIAGVAACWSHPITSTDGVVLGAMALYSNRPSSPTRSQMDGLEIAARMVGLAVERDRLEDALRQAEKLKALGVLAGGIAHDFNNVLTAVLGNAELAMDTLAEDTEAHQRLSDIVRAATSATDLCGQMLAYAGRGTLARETLELNSMVSEISSLLRVSISKKAKIVKQLSKTPLSVLADRGQLRQVILNLIGNASEAVGDNSGRIVIRTEACHYTRQQLESLYSRGDLVEGEYAKLSVMDTGVGMDSSTRAHIFDPFFTTKPTGSGLGLAAVQGIVSRHDGAISLESVPGAGTTFSVILPRVANTNERVPITSEAELALEGTRVLVVDDKPSVLSIQSDILEKGGYTVLRASDGPAAIDIFRREGDSIACVLLDYSMPGMNGEQVCKDLHDLRPGVPVILMSGFTEQEFSKRLESSGFAAFLPKPTKKADLLETISSVLNLQQPAL